MWKRVLGWILFLGGIYFASLAFISAMRMLHVPYGTDPIEFALGVTLAVALIWGGWKLAHSEK